MENETRIPRTYREAMQMGYEVYAYSKACGYVTNRLDVNNQRVRVDHGKREGELYVLGYRGLTFTYIVRIYIRPGTPKTPVLSFPYPSRKRNDI